MTAAMTTTDIDYPLDDERLDDDAMHDDGKAARDESMLRDAEHQRRMREDADRWNAEAPLRAQRAQEAAAKERTDFADELQRIADQVNAAPKYPCIGCGQAMLRAGVECGDCGDRRRKAEEDREWIAALLPPRFGWCSFDAPELATRVKDPSAVARAKAALKKGAPTVTTLLGPAGTGKTAIACCLLRVLADGGRGWGRRSGAFVDALELGVARAQASLGSEAPVVRTALTCRVLLLDELGRGKQGHHDALEDVVFRRHNENLPTIYTSGLSIEQLAKKLDDGTMRRVFEGATVIEMKASPGPQFPKRVK